MDPTSTPPADHGAGDAPADHATDTPTAPADAGEKPTASPAEGSDKPAATPAEGGAKPAEPAREATPIHYLLGFLLVVLPNAITLAIGTPGRASARARVVSQLYAGFHLVAVGLAITMAAIALTRVKKRRALLAYGLAAVTVAALGVPVLGEDVSGVAEKLPRAVPLSVWIALLAAATAQAIPLFAMIGSLLARRWVRLAGVAAGLAIAVVNGQILLQSYQGLHLLLAVVAAVLAGASLRGAPLLARLIPSAPRARVALLATLSALALVSIFAPPSNAAAVVLARESTAVLAPFIARVRGESSGTGKIPEGQRAWFTPRADRSPIPASKPSLVAPAPIVLLIGIDSLRADIIADNNNRDALPTLFALRDESVYFTMARSAGSSTAPSIASIFASEYYSQIYWTRRAETNDPFVYPHLHTTPRFPEVLQKRGVRTMTVDALGWLVNDFGIVRGFEEQASRRPTPVRPMVDKIIKRLRAQRNEPLFLFAHIVDAHFPYGTPEHGGGPFDAFVEKLGKIDSELDRLRDAIVDARLAERTTLIVMADHGESFGEHGVNTHSQNLYEEQLRVPIMIRVPDVKARVVETPITTIDLAPTILDLMGVDTPSAYMGQSLVPFLRGESPTLRRPIAAEGRLKRAIVTPDGFKVIRDPVAHTIEIFDLKSDPREENNLYPDDPRSTELLGVLDAFFHANTYRRRGYKVPFRRW